MGSGFCDSGDICPFPEIYLDVKIVVEEYY
jgi:hypothetical protein